MSTKHVAANHPGQVRQCQPQALAGEQPEPHGSAETPAELGGTVWAQWLSHAGKGGLTFMEFLGGGGRFPQER